jgi:hypothetical protein
MIITVGTEGKGADAATMPMFSRVGKTTTTQWLVFSKAAKDDVGINSSVDEDEEDVEDFFEEKKAHDIEVELKKIQKYENEKFKQTRHGANI